MKHKLKITFIIISIIFLFVTVIPQFTIKISGKEFNYPDINLSLVDIESSLFKPKQSSGVFPSQIVLVQVESLGNMSIEEVIQTIRTRIEYSGLYDIQVSTDTINDTQAIVLEFPKYYSNPNSIAQYLVKNGKIDFSNINPTQNNPINLKDTDISGSIDLQYTRDYTSAGVQFMEFNFDKSKATDLSDAFKASQNQLNVRVDNQTEFIMLYAPQSQYSDTTDAQTKVRAFPLNLDDSLETQKIKQSIFRTYFLSKPMDTNLFVSNDLIISSESDYAPYGPATISVAFIFPTLTMLGYVFYKQGKKSFVNLSLTSTLYILIVLNLIKLISVTISYGTLLGLLFAYILGMIALYQLNSSVDIKHDLRKLRLWSIFIFVIGYLAFRFGIFFGILTDFTGIVITTSVVLWILSWTYLKLIYKYE